MIDYNSLQDELDDVVNTLDVAGLLESIGFTKDQARLVNVLIIEALKLHDKSKTFVCK